MRQNFASNWPTWIRLLFGILVLWGLSNAVERLAGLPAVFAQDEEKNPSDDEPLVEDVAAAAPATEKTSAGGEQPGRRTLMDSIIAGGWIGGIIIILSIVAVAFMIEHAITIRKERLMPPAQLDQLEEMIAGGKIREATEYCQDPKNYSLASDVVLAALERYQGSEFGFADYKSAAEEAGEENTARLYRKTDMLSVIGAIAPMLGLFGTVAGIMEAFDVIASTGGKAQPADLANGISKALVTTWLGLIVAIPTMVVFSYFRNKIDGIVSECGKHVERILMPLSRRR
ncbi:MAG TPA: MotA/TolQ/ExbB proton channel family protein [Pirellulaceae bacterium]|nr:MotA/TolQ/ExbB proton channel family protein [Pirellulaceae bacterium]